MEPARARPCYSTCGHCIERHADASTSAGRKEVSTLKLIVQDCKRAMNIEREFATSCSSISRTDGIPDIPSMAGRRGSASRHTCSAYRLVGTRRHPQLPVCAQIYIAFESV